MINTLPAQEIKRRGLAAIDDIIDQGPVHVIKNNYPQYVILTEKRYQNLIALEFENEIYKKIKKESVHQSKIIDTITKEEAIERLQAFGKTNNLRLNGNV